MFDLAETGRCRRADTRRRAVIPDEMGKPCFQIIISPPESVIVGVIDNGLIILMIGFVVAGDFFGERTQFGDNLNLGQVSYRYLRPVPAHSAASLSSPGTPSSRMPAAERASSVILAPASMRATSSVR